MLNILIFVCLLYVAFLFGVAFFAEQSTKINRARWLRSPWIYTLSLSVYCTAWTFYGAVGYAARSGLEYLTIYIGPSLVMFGWWVLLRKLVRIGRRNRITSIADLISSRFGKSNSIAIFVTILAVVGTTPYIALQLQSVTLSFQVFAANDDLGLSTNLADRTAIWVAAGLAFFTILFGTRNLDVNERHDGVVMAIAVEAVVKLLALLAIGVFVVWGLSSGISETMARIDASSFGQWSVSNGRWATLTFLSAAAFLCLPRMFHVLVVENKDERFLQTASWAFPLYVALISLFVVPIAVTGLSLMPVGSNPDLYVLSLPLSQGRDGLAVFAFLGGFSSATSMVIVAALALSTMISNQIVMPLWLRYTGGRASISGDVRRVVLFARRVSIALILFLGYLYYDLSGGGAALASIGLVSFAGVAQILPVMLGGLFWRGATQKGALAGLIVGFTIWLITLFIPSVGLYGASTDTILTNGIWGVSWLRPQALFGVTSLDPLVHSVFWSMILNTATFVFVSLITLPSPIERLQSAQFVNVYDQSTQAQNWQAEAGKSEDLMVMAQRILGAEEAQRLFQIEVRKQGGSGYLPEATPEFLQKLERELSGSVGAATAHAMIGQIVGGMSVSVENLLAMADETAQMMEYSSGLEVQSAELRRTAGQLREANEKLTRLSLQKDAFLSQISHELRTPMTAILSFTEILRDNHGLSETQVAQYAEIIYDEAHRLTRLLDDLLDLSVLENGQVRLNLAETDIVEVINRATHTALSAKSGADLKIWVKMPENLPRIITDADRLGQVFLNLISNAQKYCNKAPASLRIKGVVRGTFITLDFIDNGQGVPREEQELIFEKFSRIGQPESSGAGLGLAICKEIMSRLGGDIDYLPGQGGGAFRVVLPL